MPGCPPAPHSKAPRSRAALSRVPGGPIPSRRDCPEPGAGALEYLGTRSRLLGTPRTGRSVPSLSCVVGCTICRAPDPHAWLWPVATGTNGQMSWGPGDGCVQALGVGRGRRPAWGCGHSPAVAVPPRPGPRGLLTAARSPGPCQGWPCWASQPCWAGRSCGGRARGPKVCGCGKQGPFTRCAWPGGWAGGRSAGPSLGTLGLQEEESQPGGGGWGGVSQGGAGRGTCGAGPAPWRHVSLRPDSPRCPPSGVPTGVLQAVPAS